VQTFYRFIAAVALSLLLATSVQAKPLLWSVKQGNTTIYLFGTVHLLPSDTDWVSGKLDDALNRSGRLSIELVDDDPVTMQALVMKYGLDPAHPLSQKLPAADRQKLKQAAIDAKLPMGEQSLEPMRPWLASLVLTVTPLVQAGLDPNQGVDKQLKARMIKAGKPVDGLETADQQLRILAGMSEPLQLDMLRETFQEIEDGPKKLRQLIDAWKNGDTRTIARLESTDLQQTSPELYKQLIVDRNKAWAQTIAKRLRNPAGGTSIIAVGAGHLAGPDSLQKQLEGLGFTVVTE
jgi:uncharacterized protein YbaP (TraB family)